MQIDPDLIATHNHTFAANLEADYDFLGSVSSRYNLDIASITQKVAAFQVVLPSWGVGTGGTRFGRFPMGGEPRTILEKLEDCAVVNQLTRVTAGVSTHFPWDRWSDYSELRGMATSLGLHFDAVNSNTFQDQPGQPLSYKFGSLSHTDAAVRQQAIEHNLECVSIGQQLGSRALSVWLADGSNFAGQSSFSGSFSRYISSLKNVVAGLPADWQLLIEHKCFEPAFYSTVLQDWGSSYIAATELGQQALCSTLTFGA